MTTKYKIIIRPDCLLFTAFTNSLVSPGSEPVGSGSLEGYVCNTDM